MKKVLVMLAAMFAASLLWASSGGTQSATQTLAADTTVNVSFPRDGYITVYVTGSNPVWVSFGGYSVAASADASTYYVNRFRIEPGAAYTTREKHTFVSLYSLAGSEAIVVME
jgi:hypothetical protein